MTSGGYLRTPTIAGDVICFVTEDDLWTVSAEGGVARRLTANLSAVTRPALSPDGEWVAFTSQDEHHPEVYVMPGGGGSARRLTWLASTSVVRGWTRDGEIVFASDHAQPFAGRAVLRTIRPDGGAIDTLPWGFATEITWSAGGAVVLGRNTGDPARWKRYRGGTAGRLWVDGRGAGTFRPLLGDLDGNLAHPMWIGDRVYFVSDHEGVANIYSCRPDGRDVRRHTDHDRYYARFAASDGRRIVYANGADIRLLDPATDEDRQVEIDLRSPRVQRQRRFVQATNYLRDAQLHPSGHSLLLTVRGKVFTMGLWEGAVRQIGPDDGSRSRLARWLDDGSELILLSDRDGEDVLEIHRSGAYAAPETPPGGADGAVTDGTPTGRSGAGRTPGGRTPTGRTARRSAGGAATSRTAEAARRRHSLGTMRAKVVRAGDARRLVGLDLGCVTELAPAPVGPLVALATHRYELLLVDTTKAVAHVLDRSAHASLDGLAWSPDGRWLAYGIGTTTQTKSIRVCDTSTGELHDVTPPEFRDYSPAFDPDGKYLYFLSTRVFNPVQDALYFDLGFPRATKPYLVTLRADVPNPFVPSPRGLSAKPAGQNQGGDQSQGRPGRNGAGRAPTPGPVVIDFDGIADRILALPSPEGRYLQVRGLSAKALFTTRPVEGRLGGPSPDGANGNGPPAAGAIEAFDFNELRHDTLISGVNGFSVSRDNSTLLYDAGGRLRAVRAGEKPQDNTDREPPGRRSGWIDLNRVKVSLDPGAEWQQMFGEAWRLQRDHFWNAELSGVDWLEVRERYRPLVDRVATRIEFSDLMWEMQGELGTSHAYEMGGDHRPAPEGAAGHLGADYAFDGAAGLWRVARFVDGDAWDPDAASPLAGAGVGVRVGDAIVSVNGQPVDPAQGPSALLVNQAGMLVELGISPADHPRSQRTVTVRTLRDERQTRYRDWVRANRRRVHDATEGRVGYVHVPDMGPRGYAEFHRAYLAEVARDALIVDVRFNGGGNVSSLVLEKLGRKRIGYDVNRWLPPEPYPADSPAGPLVAITNENAGSDGDIFTHCFKLMGLGPVVGKRTWGGVIGISPRHALSDGSVTTQPEYSFWFVDVGWGVENYGTDPDHDVDIRPQDYAAGLDPQLDKAIQLAQRALKSWRPVRPDGAPIPNLARPSLPARQAAAAEKHAPAGRARSRARR